jgi:hypothetical protein
MTRITFTTEGGELAWFDEAKATAYKADTYWDGHNSVDVNTNDQFTHQVLYHTAGGRWVLHTWSQWQGARPTYEFVDPGVARDWLIKNDEAAAASQHFGDVEDERGPGRPEIGRVVNVRLGDELLAAVDAEATRREMPRAAVLRELVEAGLAATVAG